MAKNFRSYKENPEFIKPLSRYNEVTQFVKKGLNDLSVSRHPHMGYKSTR